MFGRRTRDTYGLLLIPLRRLDESPGFPNVWVQENNFRPLKKRLMKRKSPSHPS
jgi:hypothetical protein